MGMNYLKGETFYRADKTPVKILALLPISKEADHAREEGEVPDMNYRILSGDKELVLDYIGLEKHIWLNNRYN